MENDLEMLHSTIEGRVQGVGFRYFVLEKAQDLKLTGWVRNCWNGNVEVLAEGSRDALEKLLVFLRQGPRAAMVTNIEYEWKEASGRYARFGVEPTSRPS